MNITDFQVFGSETCLESIEGDVENVILRTIYDHKIC
jgi:hypothetical protein